MSNNTDKTGSGPPDTSLHSSIDGGVSEINLSTPVFVISHDAVWARLVAQNLAARGVNVRRCLPDEINSLVAEGRTGGWLVVDTEDQSSEFRELLGGVTQVLRKASVKTLAVVDSMAGHAQLVDIDADAIVSRTADMRVLVRKLLCVFSASPMERAVATVQSDW